MGADEAVAETTVSDRYEVTIPSEIRARLGVQPGDTVRWTLTDGGTLRVEVIRQRNRAFDDFGPIPLGPTNAADDHDEILAREVERDSP